MFNFFACYLLSAFPGNTLGLPARRPPPIRRTRVLRAVLLLILRLLLPNAELLSVAAVLLRKGEVLRNNQTSHGRTGQSHHSTAQQPRANDRNDQREGIPIEYHYQLSSQQRQHYTRSYKHQQRQYQLPHVLFVVFFYSFFCSTFALHKLFSSPFAPSVHPRSHTDSASHFPAARVLHDRDTVRAAGLQGHAAQLWWGVLGRMVLAAKSMRRARVHQKGDFQQTVLRFSPGVSVFQVRAEGARLLWL